MLAGTLDKIHPRQGTQENAATDMNDLQHDIALMQRIADKDDAALQSLYADCGQRMYAYALRLTGDPALAEDVVQDALVAVWHSAKKYRGEGRLMAWLLGIVHHTALKAMRRKPALSLSIEMENTLPARDPLPEERLQTNEEMHLVKSALNQLSAEHRAVLELVFYQGMSLNEAAAVCDCPGRHNQKPPELRPQTFARTAEPHGGNLMNEHDPDTIVLYAAGQLAADEAAAVESHLPICPECQAALAFWRELGTEINTSSAAVTPPPDLAERALSQINAPSPLKRALQHTAALLRSQLILVRREMWAASAAFMALVIIMAFLSRQTGFLTALAPMLAAATLAAIYGPQNDPASELALATPTSPWKVLLARMSIVSAYNLVLALAASLALLLIIPVDLLGSIILAWLVRWPFFLPCPAALPVDRHQQRHHH